MVPVAVRQHYRWRTYKSKNADHLHFKYKTAYAQLLTWLKFKFIRLVGFVITITKNWYIVVTSDFSQSWQTKEITFNFWPLTSVHVRGGDVRNFSEILLLFWKMNTFASSSCTRYDFISDERLTPPACWHDIVFSWMNANGGLEVNNISYRNRELLYCRIYAKQRGQVRTGNVTCG